MMTGFFLALVRDALFSVILIHVIVFIEIKVRQKEYNL